MRAMGTSKFKDVIEYYEDNYDSEEEYQFMHLSYPITFFANTFLNIQDIPNIRGFDKAISACDTCVRADRRTAAMKLLLLHYHNAEFKPEYIAKIRGEFEDNTFKDHGIIKDQDWNEFKQDWNEWMISINWTDCVLGDI